MFEILSFLIAFFGTLVASYYDLKTTEIPDVLPIIMIFLGIFTNILNYLFTKNFEIISQMIFNGALFSFIGFLMYFFGQWGMGDAFLLSSIGFISPINPSLRGEFPFFFDYLTNLFLLGALYMIVYSIVYSLKNRQVLNFFKAEIKSNALNLQLSFLILFLFSIFISYYLFNNIQVKLIVVTISITYLILLILLFSKSVEKTFFKKIPISKLKVGDVLANSKRWDGISEKELKEIRKSGKKYVYIKTGICFAPSFLIALLFTFFVGNSLFYLLNLIEALI